MAVTPVKSPSQAQFFGALAVGALILVCTAVIMTQRPVWMVGEEPSLGVLRPFSETTAPKQVYTPQQLKRIATEGIEEGSVSTKGVKGGQILADANGDSEEAEHAEEEEMENPSQAAVIAAAQREGAGLHKDDAYVDIEHAPGPRYPPTHSGQDLDVLQYGEYPVDTGSHTSKRLRAQDTIVPIGMVQMSQYPILGLQDSMGVSDHSTTSPDAPLTANLLFGKALRNNGLGDGEYVETVTGGLGANSEPPIDRVVDALTTGDEDDGMLSTMLLWGLVLLILIGGIIILGYNLLPPGSFSRAWQGDDTVADDEEGKWTRAYYAPAGQDTYGGQQMRQV
eukprot:CAMPEP_0181315808 /NCGR_PEP_ID=MMETSP1101-20121128/15568_1 /TAXON_ID=46948 /ORGANISM="Rhodomonas abbreviata, Strain Caron Lab Isolate" /LENGTH=336 /DNA_ID=CAMNT_0023423031 /DNA_START=11 /DNA_END=1021 /DNA_ORIENTATION=-